MLSNSCNLINFFSNLMLSFVRFRTRFKEDERFELKILAQSIEIMIGYVTKVMHGWKKGKSIIYK